MAARTLGARVGHQRHEGDAIVRRIGRSIRQTAAVAWGLLSASVSTLVRHWALTLFSLVAAFGVWFTIQDVENPRVEGVVPVAEVEQGIRIEAVNVPDGFIVVDPSPIHVRVEARKDDLPTLRAGDFKATVDVQNVVPGSPASKPVRVESRRNGVTVIAAEPSSVEINLVQAETREFPVQVNRVGRLPEGYVETDLPAADPAFIKVTGRVELVDTVKSVDVDINLSGARDSTTVIEGELVARTASGNPVALTLSQPRVRVTFKIEQTFSQRTVPLTPAIIGSPAPGYLVTNITVEPAVVVVTGVKAVVDSLKQINVEKIDITSANRNIIQTRQLERPPNVATDRQTVVVRVEIRPIDCTGGGGAANTPCGSASFVVAVTFVNQPLTVVIEDAAYFAQVRVSGPLDRLAALKQSDFKATVSLSGASPGTLTFPVTVTAPPGVKVESVDPLNVTLKAVLAP
jgi:YbbR domain-containing protein